MTIPNNVADLVAAARTGDLGLIDNVLIGELIVNALTGLNNSESLFVTRKAIQDGSTRTDMAVEDAQPLVLNIVLANPEYSADEIAKAALTGNLSALTQTWRDKKKQLYQYKNDREILSVQTHEELYTNCLISSINPVNDVEENYDAFIASVTFERIGIFGQSENTDNKLASVKQNVSNL